MRASSLILAITLSLGWTPQVVEAASPVFDAKAKTTDIYIVVFDEPALAVFEGFDRADKSRPRLAATSPSVIGTAKLDVNSVESRLSPIPG